MADRELLKNLLTQISSAETEVDRATLITTLSDSIDEIFTETEQLNTQVTSLNEQVSKYSKLNQDLMIRIGVIGESAQVEETTAPPEKLSFDDITF